MRLVDTHAHLHFHQFEKDLDQIIKKLDSHKFAFVVNVGIDVEDSKKALALSEKYEKLYCSIGIHPHEAGRAPEDFLHTFEELLKNKKVVAIGECGLDYYRMLSPKELQREVFEKQLKFAKDVDMPLIVHIRDAYEDAYEILSRVGLPTNGGVVHAFSADEEWALKFVELGMYIGIGGPITYPNNHTLRRVVRVVGIENILIETDCPYLAPQPVRGKRNEPIYVRFVVEEIAKILDMDIEDVAETTVKNAEELFKP
ncbi:TatD family hydrolase [Thermotoga sp. Ku-13t]|uniref:TatD family hydrolase n=1 Tax=Thermotoga sp. Ku-13t TaxID=1755813 RepID=UPI0013EE36CC|nr:TatD family hydrolase [Thermotoga sp. Ku-13t]